MHTLRRTYRGKAEHEPPSGGDKRAEQITSSAVGDLRRLAASGPGAARDAATYAAFAGVARLALALAMAGGSGRHRAWERDDSSRAG